MGPGQLTPFAIDALHREPWRNGAGWTRTVYTHAVEGEVLWRISVADITAASAFSRFPDMDRTAVMVQGGRLQLSNAEVRRDLDGVGSQIQFPGEWSLRCSAPESAHTPTQLLNIMVRRGQAQARVRTVTNSAFTLAAGEPHVVLVLCGAFRWTAPSGASHTLQTRHGMHWQHAPEDWHAQPLGSDAVMVCCTLRC